MELIFQKTGAPLAAFKRIQMNIFLKRFEDINTLANVSEGLFPLIWVEEVCYLKHISSIEIFIVYKNNKQKVINLNSYVNKEL